jgi:predicted transcriptional regulator
VVAAGRVVGLLTPAMARAAAPGALAGDVATAQHPVVQVAPDEPMSEVVERLRTAGAVAALVVEDGRVIGAIEPADVARARTRR